MRFIVYLCSSLLAVAGGAANNDFTFHPNSAEPQGGAEIQIVANGFVRFTAPQVFFGGVPSPHVALVNAVTLTAVAPAHAIGIVAVTVRDNGVLLSSAGEFVFAPVLEEILIPIAFQPTDAGHGTRWVSDISVYNESDDTVSIDPEICFWIGRPFDCSQGARRVLPHSSMRIEPGSQSAGNPAMLLRPPADHVERLHFNVRLRETSRDPDDPGTEIPVVRSSQFQRKHVWLPSIPVSSRLRSTLRVFTRGTNVVVLVRDDTTGELLKTLQTFRFLPTDNDPFGTLTFPGLLEAAEVAAHERVRIEVEAESPVWALLTLTGNATQRLQIFTPQ